jgi:outer membrane protein assembly factor BamB
MGCASRGMSRIRKRRWGVGQEDGRMKPIAAFLLSLTISAHAAEMFRGDAAHTGHHAGAGPIGRPRLVWAAQTGGPVRSSPAVTADAVYIGSEDGFVYAFDRETGRERWKYAAGGAVNSSPALHGERVFAGSANGFLHCLSRSTGKQLWRVEIGADTTPKWGYEYFASSPAIADGVVYIGSATGRVYAVDETTGKLRWSSPQVGEKIIASPAVAAGLVLIGSDAGRVYALDRRSGKEQWTFETEGAHINSAEAGFDHRSVVASPAVLGDAVVVIGGRDGFLYGISLADGHELWRFDEKVFWVVGSAAVWRDHALVGTSDGKAFQSFDRAGKLEWSVPLPDRVFSSAWVAGDVAYVGCHDGSLFAIDAQSGGFIWRYWIGAPITSSPVVRDAVVYVGADDGAVYAIGASSEPPIVKRAVFWTDARPLWFREGAQLRDYARHSGYEQVDAAALEAFLRDRIADHSPSVVLFATERVPIEAGAEPDSTSLLVRYIESGGRVAWLGLPPFALKLDAAGKPVGVDMKRPAAFLGVSFEEQAHDQLPVRATPSGRSRGVPAWRMGSGGVARQAVDDVLAADDYGRAVTWIRRLGSGDFMMIDGSETIGMDLAHLIRVIESGTAP